MSRYAGNHDACPRCGLRYKDLRTGLDWREVFAGLWSHDDDPTTWRYKRRNTILGKWHQLKLEAWRHHLETCRARRRRARATIAKSLARRLVRELQRWDVTEGAGF